MTVSTIRISTDGAVARVTLARAAARNALNLDMCRDLAGAFAALDGDEDVSVVLLEADGETFSAGADLKERQGKDGEWVRQRRLAAFAAYSAIEKCRKPVVAVVQGAAIGSGSEMAMCCDFIIASTAASFQFPEVKWGTVGATQRLQRVIGKRGAKELLYTGRRMPVREARDRGLVARLFAPEDLALAATDIAIAIASAPRLSMRLTKQCIDLGELADLETGIGIELVAIDQCLADGGWRDGIERFVAVHDGGD